MMDLTIFSLVEADLTMDDPDVQFGVLEGWLIEFLIGLGSDWILEPLSEGLLDVLLAELGTIEIGGPFAFETDLMGTTFGIALSDLYGDPEGLALGLEVQLGESSTADAWMIPVPGVDDAPEAQVALGLHEGLLQQLLVVWLKRLLARR